MAATLAPRARTGGSGAGTTHLQWALQGRAAAPRGPSWGGIWTPGCSSCAICCHVDAQLSAAQVAEGRMSTVTRINVPAHNPTRPTRRSLSDPVEIYDSKPVEEYRPLKKRQAMPAAPLSRAVSRVSLAPSRLRAPAPHAGLRAHGLAPLAAGRAACGSLAALSLACVPRFRCRQDAHASEVAAGGAEGCDVNIVHTALAAPPLLPQCSLRPCRLHRRRCGRAWMRRIAARKGRQRRATTCEPRPSALGLPLCGTAGVLA